MRIFGTPLGWIMWLIYEFIQNYGLALIIFTVIIKVCLFPLSIKQQKSSAKMSVFQPKVNEINKKYANNKQKQQEELMKLYEAHGYNPMSGCLPMLIQFPILFGIIDVVYYPLKHILRLDKEVIASLTDIVSQHVNAPGQLELQVVSAVQDPARVGWFSSIDPEIISAIQNFDYTLFGLDMGLIPTFGWNWLAIVPLLSGITSLAVSVLSMKLTPGASENKGTMRSMMYMMPLMSVWIAFSVPVGVGIYWILSNIMSGIQSVVLHLMYNPEKFKAEYEQQMKEEEERRRQERLERQKKRREAGLEEEEEEKPKKKKKAAPVEEETPAAPRDPKAEYMSTKEINRRRLAEARRRDAEKYGEEYVEVTDDDLK